MQKLKSITPARQDHRTTNRTITIAVLATLSTVLFSGNGFAIDDPSIRPFTVHVPENDLLDLRKRILATRWPANRGRSVAGGAISETPVAFALLGH